MILTILGQVRGGKNHVNITRTGMRYPNREWAAWRDGVVLIMKEQASRCFPRSFDVPVMAHIAYVRGDNRRRDVPALMDALWHCLERAGIVFDDVLIKDVVWESLPISRKIPSVRIELIPLDKSSA